MEIDTPGRLHNSWRVRQREYPQATLNGPVSGPFWVSLSGLERDLWGCVPRLHVPVRVRRLFS